MSRNCDEQRVDSQVCIHKESSISCLEGIGPQRTQALGQLGISTVGDLLSHFPTRYEDRSNITQVAEAPAGQVVTLRVRVVRSRNVRLRGKLSLAEVVVADDSGQVRATFFGRGFMATSVFRPGTTLILTGTLTEGSPPALPNPEYEVLEQGDETGLHTGRIVPIYPSSEGLSQRALRRWIATALDASLDSDTSWQSVVPGDYTRRWKLLEGIKALREIHFPSSLESCQQAKRTLALQELLILQTAILKERAVEAASASIRHVVNGPCLKKLHKLLPFTLTEEQERAISEVLLNMAAPRPMRRLVQGDVGSGKTMVALHAIAASADTGCQSAFMAPTEILATQHFLQLRSLLEPLGLRVAFLTGNQTEARNTRRALASGEVDVVVGTHALFQRATEFSRLGLVVIDEQHRFGVSQRQELASKGVSPDLLQLTATPIPRSLALTAYGHLDVSVIRSLPPGRQPIQTRHVGQREVGRMYATIRREIEAGRQAYVVCPLIDESDARQARAVLTHYEELSSGPLAAWKVGLLHGRMKPDEKAEAMQRFKCGEHQVLVATTVIEVGVDVPNATVMVIEDAHSFSISQLHQIRGRVGRGEHPSYCFLTGQATTDSGRKRIEVLCDCSDGFELAEADLEIRGPGAFYGVRQAGLSDLRAASLISDVRLIEDARHAAHAILKADPELKRARHAGLSKSILRRGAPIGT